MDELKRIGVFTKVVQASSFSEAARQLGMAKSAVSKQVTLLEQEVGVRLLHRTTRKLSLTEAGQLYYRHCQQIVDRADIALNELRQYQQQPTGTLRVASSIDFGSSELVPIIKELRGIYPHLNIELMLENRIVNMIEEGIDVTVRLGWLQDSNLVAKKLGNSPMVTFASPAYLARHGTPKTPQDLLQHEWINLSLLPAPLRWQYRHKITGATESVQMNSALTCNASSGALSMALAGLGITVLGQVDISQHLQRGELVPLLADYQLEPLGIYAVYPHRQHLPAKVRIFLEFLEKHCQNSEWAMSEYS